MEHHFVYILYSSKIDKYYVGYSESPDKRLDFHNSALNKIWTRRGQPWELKTTVLFDSSIKALSVERKIKKLKSRSVIENIIKNGWIE